MFDLRFVEKFVKEMSVPKNYNESRVKYYYQGESFNFVMSGGGKDEGSKNHFRYALTCGDTGNFHHIGIR